ncbi:DUF4468 domain-containing protein [Hymenobacter sp. DG25B]|uniref:DUF4468 domain-containing protein n=1 Tax=Hymenobacter sp. DG25B TaxID=1385664 RepID=UPI0018CFA8EC|nr:DUF4468 domain-containing protein [Hymenobacter sp. DG25B]
MKTTLLSLVCCGMLFFSAPLLAQTTDSAPIEYSEQVPAPEPGKNALFLRGANWVENRFAFGPTTGFRKDAATGEVRVTGTSKVTPVTASGKDQDYTVRFEFVFRCTEQGYNYSVGSFRCVTDPENPTATVPLDEYISQLAQERSNSRTHNDRRVRAQATALASEIAMSFRSYMNSMPVTDDSTVGLPAADGR